jgi:hypothetical protein
MAYKHFLEQKGYHFNEKNEIISMPENSPILEAYIREISFKICRSTGRRTEARLSLNSERKCIICLYEEYKKHTS